MHVYVFPGGGIDFISKGFISINKLKYMLGFCEKLVLFSMTRKRALKMIIKCSICTKAGTTHSPLKNNFS